MRGIFPIAGVPLSSRMDAAFAPLWACLPKRPQQSIRALRWRPTSEGPALGRSALVSGLSIALFPPNTDACVFQNPTCGPFQVGEREFSRYSKGGLPQQSSRVALEMTTVTRFRAARPASPRRKIGRISPTDPQSSREAPKADEITPRPQNPVIDTDTGRGSGNLAGPAKRVSGRPTGPLTISPNPDRIAPFPRVGLHASAGSRNKPRITGPPMYRAMNPLKLSFTRGP